ncbi:MAG: 5-oxoprolinase subunit PxpA [Lachnospiraceae bacterium]|nr:5-oxoprolinase subunit PxpA [Lachnospiraceae bacterium]
MVKIDLNSDIGESFGRYTLGMDDQIIPLISSCNIACGYHAADPMVMDKTVKLAKEAGIAIGAHPGYPDLMGFGRRNMVVTPEEGAAYVTYQLGALYGFAKKHGMKIQHVKPHGALYNMAGKDYELALAIAKAIQAFDPELICLALAGSQSVKAARDIGLPVAQEVFADRAYMPDGSLVPRSRPDSMITDEKLAIERVVRMVKEHKVTAVDGQDIEIIPDSICVHGDNAKALAFVSEIRSTLESEGVVIASIEDVLKQ